MTFIAVILAFVAGIMLNAESSSWGLRDFAAIAILSVAAMVASVASR